MITAIVQFKLPTPLPREKAEQMFMDSAPKYQQIPGLIRKYYILSENGNASGGVYIFESKKDAEKLYTEEWKRYIEKKYGGKPSISYYNVPVVVDNLSGEIIKDK